MLFSILRSQNITEALISILLSLPIIMLTISIHETAHGWMAKKCGDNTAYNLGRLTLNPLKHFDLFGFLAMLLVGYGWAKPVPVNARNFRNHKRGMALTAAAGPGINLIVGVICAVLAGVSGGASAIIPFPNQFSADVYGWMISFLLLAAQYNFLFMIFNLIPVPPFDGSRIAYVFLPDRIYFGVMRYERQIMYGVLIAMVVLSNFTNFSFGNIAGRITELIYYKIGNSILQLLSLLPH